MDTRGADATHAEDAGVTGGGSSAGRPRHSDARGQPDPRRDAAVRPRGGPSRPAGCAKAAALVENEPDAHDAVAGTAELVVQRKAADGARATHGLQYAPSARQAEPQDVPTMKDPGAPAASPPRGTPAAGHPLPLHPGPRGRHPLVVLAAAIAQTLDLELDRQDTSSPWRIASVGPRRTSGPDTAEDGATLSEEADRCLT